MVTTPADDLVLSFPKARQVVEREAGRVQHGSAEIVPLLESLHRVLAQDLLADRPLPPFPRAARDGYAVRAEGLQSPHVRLRVTGEIRAGQSSSITIHPGEAAAIMTGAAAPAGANAVVMLEETSRAGDLVEILRAVKPGQNIVPLGAEAQPGSVLVRSGAWITPAVIAVAASVGQERLAVFQRPRVSILATGDELVDVAATPGPVQIRNSNSYSLAAQVLSAGATPVVLAPARDEHQQLHASVEQGLEADLLVLSGGVSVGKYDLVEEVLGSLGARILFTGVLIQPGKPVIFGYVEQKHKTKPTYFFGLPGNPVSTLITFELFVRPFLEALCGAQFKPISFLQARIKHEFQTRPGLTRFLPAILSGELEDPQVELIRWQGSGDISSAAKANCFLVVPPDRNLIKAGQMVSVTPAP